MKPWFLPISLAYLLGSIPFGHSCLCASFARRTSARAGRSGNIGATNVARSGAKGLGFATLLLDLGKAFVAVKIAQWLVPGNYDVAVGCCSCGDFRTCVSGVAGLTRRQGSGEWTGECFWR